MIKPEYGDIMSANKKRSEVRINAESVLPTGSEVKKPLSLTARVFPLGTENKESSTTVKGRVTFTFVYLTDDGYGKAESATDVMADLALEKAEAVFSVDDVRAVASGDGYTARCSVTVSGETTAGDNKKVLAGGEDLFVKEKTETVDSSVGKTKENFTVNDEFTLDRAVVEVLSYGADVSVENTDAGVGKITAEGAVLLTLKTVGKENDGITDERRAIPFRLDLENSGVLPEMRVCAKIDVVKINLKVFTDEDKNTSAVNVEAILSFSGEGFAEEKAVFAEDVYSATDITTVKRNSFKTEIFSRQYEKTERVSGEAGETAETGAKIVGLFGEKATVISDKNGSIDGVITGDAVFKNSDNGFSVVNLKLPFSIDVDEGDRLSYLFVSDASARTQDGKVVLDCALKSGYKSFNDKKIEYIESVSSDGERKISTSAISVFVPSAGDGVWQVAKEIGISSEEVVKNNPELAFPLTGEERILVYRQKF